MEGQRDAGREKEGCDDVGDVSLDIDIVHGSSTRLVWEKRVPLVLIAITVLGGLTMGLALPNESNHVPGRWGKVSSVLGFTYTIAWSASFYPQTVLNWERKSVRGLSLDYQSFNIIGFVCYAVFNSFFFWDAATQRAYEASHHGHENKVQLNDVIFSLHAVVLTAITITQCIIYDRAGQVVSRSCKLLCAAILAASALYLVLVASLSDRGGFFSWIYYLYWLSYVKVAISFIKYVPQVYMNYRRKSTEGWNIWNVLLDLTGGFLSVLQLILDSWATDDWSGITGDAAKFALGFLSIFFDIIFVVQHYCIYPSAPPPEQSSSVNSRTEPEKKRLLEHVVI